MLNFHARFCFQLINLRKGLIQEINDYTPLHIGIRHYIIGECSEPQTDFPLYSGRPQALFLFFCFERAWCAKIRHVMSLWTSVGVSMEMPPFTMTLFQSAYSQVVAWWEYSSSETDGRIASQLYDNSLQLAVVRTTHHFGPTQISEGRRSL